MLEYQNLLQHYFSLRFLQFLMIEQSLCDSAKFSDLYLVFYKLFLDTVNRSSCVYANTLKFRDARILRRASSQNASQKVGFWNAWCAKALRVHQSARRAGATWECRGVTSETLNIAFNMTAHATRRGLVRTCLFSSSSWRGSSRVCGNRRRYHLRVEEGFKGAWVWWWMRRGKEMWRESERPDCDYRIL